MKKIKAHPRESVGARTDLKSLNKEIKKYFYQLKGKSIHRGILPGNSKTLWDAVKLANDVNPQTLPNEMLVNNTKIAEDSLPEVFGKFFSQKVNSISNNLQVNPTVYNGKRKVITPNKFFMSSTDILEIMSDI